MTVIHFGNQQYQGLSTDTKPLAADTAVNAIFEETNTRKRYYNTGTQWIPQEVGNYLKYRVLKVGTTYYIIDQVGREIGSGTDCQVALQAAIDAMAPGLLEFTFDSGIYVINNPIIIPSVSRSTAQKRVMFKGIPWSRRAGTDKHDTEFHIPASWPTNRYVFECNNAPGSATMGFLEIEGLFVTAFDAFTTKNVGLVKYEVDQVAVNCLHLEDLTGEYMWRGLHLIGGVWRSTFNHLDFEENNSAFVGDADIIMEWGGTTATEGPMPKLNIFTNTIIGHGDGTMNNFVRIKGGSYNFFNHIEADGYRCTEAGYNLDATDYVLDTRFPVASNTFIDAWILDVIGTPSPDNRKGGIYLNGTGCFDNRFIGAKVNKIVNTVKVSGGALRNRVEIAGQWGGVPVVDSTGAGAQNTLEITGGHGIEVDNVIVDTAGNFRIVDYRRSAQNGGISTQSGNGSTKVFNIAHGLFSTPAKKRAFAGSDDARGSFKVTADATNVILTYPIAPPTGTNNLSFEWAAELYK